MIQNEYINPFGLMDDHEKEKLGNLSSGIPINDSDADKILDMFSTGTKFYDSFRKERLKSTDTLFHGSIKQNKYVSFSKSSASATIKSNDGKKR